MSVGKFPGSDNTTLRPGRIPSAAQTSLNRFTETLSQAITSPGSAPISGAMASPTRRGRPIQSAPPASLGFQLRTSPSPHSRSTVRARRPGVARGIAPSELPSR